MQEPILDEHFYTEDNLPALRKERMRLWAAIAAGIVLNSILLSLPKLAPHKLVQSAIRVTIGCFIPGFLAGLLVALFPYKQLPYSAKYLRASQWSMVVILIVVAGSMCIVMYHFYNGSWKS